MTFSNLGPEQRHGFGPEIRVRDEAIDLPSRSYANWLRSTIFEKFVIAVDGILIVACGVGCTVLYHLLTAGVAGPANVFSAVSSVVALNFGLLVTVQHGYRLKNLAELTRQWRITLGTWTGVFGAFLAIAFSMKVSDEFSRGATISFYVVGLTVLLMWKTGVSVWAAHALRSSSFANGRAVIIAELGLCASSSSLVEMRQHGYRIMRIIEIGGKELSSPLLMSRFTSAFADLVDYTREHKIEHIFLLIDWNRQHAIDSILDALKVLPIPVQLLPDRNVSRYLRYPLASVGNTWTAELRRAPLSWKECAVKRALDVVGALLALMVFAPIMLMAAIFVSSTSRGPVLFRQNRNGFNGRTFKILKFRTMRVLEDGPKVVQAVRDDPRVTLVGRWLRKTSIDELPQIFNVLKGDMSLVGPRPHAVAHNTEYQHLISQYAYRQHVKPGITGWAQVNGYRGETRALEMMQKRVEHDLWYINNWSLWIDFYIILRTALKALDQREAY